MQRLPHGRPFKPNRLGAVCVMIATTILGAIPRVFETLRSHHTPGYYGNPVARKLYGVRPSQN